MQENPWLTRGCCGHDKQGGLKQRISVSVCLCVCVVGGVLYKCMSHLLPRGHISSMGFFFPLQFCGGSVLRLAALSSLCVCVCMCVCVHVDSV